MSRLRRMVLCDRFFFLSCRVLPTRRYLDESEFACLAQVVQVEADAVKARLGVRRLDAALEYAEHSGDVPTAPGKSK